MRDPVSDTRPWIISRDTLGPDGKTVREYLGSSLGPYKVWTSSIRFAARYAAQPGSMFFRLIDGGETARPLRTKRTLTLMHCNLLEIGRALGATDGESTVGAARRVVSERDEAIKRAEKAEHLNYVEWANAASKATERAEQERDAAIVRTEDYERRLQSEKEHTAFLEAERDALAKERDALAKERDTAVDEYTKEWGKRGMLATECHELKKERDALKHQVTKLKEVLRTSGERLVSMSQMATRSDT